MKVALIQMEIAEKNTPGNIVHGLDLLQEAAANSDIAVLPEIWTTGYSLGRIEEEAETIDGSTIAAVRKIADDQVTVQSFQGLFLCVIKMEKFITIP